MSWRRVIAAAFGGRSEHRWRRPAAPPESGMARRARDEPRRRGTNRGAGAGRADTSPAMQQTHVEPAGREQDFWNRHLSWRRPFEIAVWAMVFGAGAAANVA